MCSRRQRKCEAKPISGIVKKTALAAVLGLFLTIVGPSPLSAVQDVQLPDMGSPADGLLSIATEAQIGRQVYANLLSTGAVMTDPELQEYIQDVGMRLVAHADIKRDQRFNFFVVESPVINAFALPGGYIGVHSGLLLATANESQLAGVLAHEISHVTQRHISRAVFANQRASTLNLATMLGAILVGVAAGADADMVAGAVSIGQGMAIEQQIAFTRNNEYEADRVAVEVLANAGFDPQGMPDFFETMSRNASSLSRQAPTFLRTHPVSADRMAETRDRARGYPPVDAVDSPEYELTRGRARQLVSSRPELSLEFFNEESQRPGNAEKLEFQYGHALALTEIGRDAEAEVIFRELLGRYDTVIPLYSALAETLVQQNKAAEALQIYSEAIELFPRNVPLTVRYAETLMRYDQPQKAHDLLLDLLNQVPPTLEQVRLIALAANQADDIANTHYYMAEYQAMNGNLRLAIDQLLLALSTPGLDSVERAKFEARLREFQNYLPKRKSN